MTTQGNEELSVGLETRHVFVDTQVYRSYHHDMNARILKVLGEYVSDGVFVLHTTDVTLREVRRQLLSLERDLRNRTNGIAKELSRWNRRCRHERDWLPVPSTLDELVDSSAAYRDFEHRLRIQWNAHEHRAAEIPAGRVLDRYFDRWAPFDEKGSKEFPDALALLALEDWCSGADERMYVVSNDKAVSRAAKESAHLIAVDSLKDLFGLVESAAEHGMAKKVDDALDDRSILTELRDSLNDSVDDLGVVYQGDRAEGDVLATKVEELKGVEEVAILRVDQVQVACFAKVMLAVSAEIEYADRSMAWWDNEEKQYYGVEHVTAEIKESIRARIFVEFKRDGEELILSLAGFLKELTVVNLNVSSDWQFVRVEGSRLALVTRGGSVGLTPLGDDFDSSWECPTCGSAGPWDAALCLSCGRRHEPD